MVIVPPQRGTKCQGSPTPTGFPYELRQIVIVGLMVLVLREQVSV
jgi:hypothetical protein